MIRAAGFSLTAALFAQGAMAQGVERFALSEVLPAATAMTTVGQGMLFVATPDAGFFCILSIRDSFVEGLAGDDLRGVGRPLGTCVDVGVFETHEN